MWVVYFFWSSSPLSWRTRMLISHWLIACNVVDVVMLSLSLFMPHTAFHWNVFKINMMMMKILHKFSTFPLLIDCGLHSNAYEWVWLKKTYFELISRAMKIWNKNSKFMNSFSDFFIGIFLSSLAFRWNFFMKKHFLHHYEFASHLITKNCIILKPTTWFTLQRYPIKLFAIYPT